MTWQAVWVEPVQEPTHVERYSPERDDIRSRWPKTAVDTALLRPAQLVRLEFDVVRSPVRARLFSTAHGVYKVFINGNSANDHQLAPDWTPYRKLLMVQETDLTAAIQVGRNALGFVVADGWWAGRVGMHGTSANFGDRLGLLAQLEIEYPDGSSHVIASSESFKSSPAEIVYADFLMGEKHDLRLQQHGWMLPGFDDSGWAPVLSVNAAFSNLAPQIGPSARKVAELSCARVMRTPNGDTLLDFAQNITGRVRADLAGAGGTEITFDYFETLGPDGNVFDNVLAMNQTNRDVVVLGEAGHATFEPLFAFHGFRYVRVNGHSAHLSAESFTAIALSSLQEPTRTFACSDARLNQLYSNIAWTMRSTMLSVPMDNPDRERVGWTGDLVLIVRTAASMFDMHGFLERWLASLRAEQEPDGAVPMVVPMFDGYRDWFESRFKTYATSGWGDAAIIVPWAAYEAYGDKSVLERSFDSMARWLEFERMQAAASLTEEDRQDPARAFLWRADAFHFGDWLTPSVRTLTPAGMYDGRGMAVATKELLPTIWYARSASIMAAASSVLGDGKRAHEYRTLASNIRQSFCTAFFRDGSLTDERQGNYVLAAAFDMVPGQRQRLADRLAQLICDNNNRLDTGFVSTAFVLRVLADHGHSGLAYELLMSDKHPSWLYQLERGATTVWEMWDSVLPDGNVTRTSQIQPALGTVGEWLHEYVGGLRPASPGYREVIIDPLVGGGLTWARTSQRVAAGSIATAWRVLEDRLAISVELPTGIAGKVLLRGISKDEIRMGDAAAAECPGLRVEQSGPDALIHCPAGNHDFTVPRQQSVGAFNR